MADDRSLDGFTGLSDTRAPSRAIALLGDLASGLSRACATAAPALVGLVAVGGLAVSDGGYFPRTWGWASLGLLWVAMVALFVRRRIRLGLLEALMLVPLVALVAWTAASLAWSMDVPQTVLEVERAVVYVAGPLAIVLITRRRSVPHLLGGLLMAVALVGTYALATRLFPDRLGVFDPIAVYRLSQPLGYWNALGIFTAIGILLAVGFAARARAIGVRALAAAAVVLLAPTLYFTFGRGPWIALAAGLIVAVAVDPRRLQLITVVLLVAPGAALAVWLCSRSEALTRQQTTLAAAAADGRRLAPVILGLAAAAAAVVFMVAVLERRLEVPRAARVAYGATIVLATVAVLAFVFGHYGSPPTIARNAYEGFKAPPVGITRPGSDLNRRLFSFSGNGRPDLWRVGWEDYKRHPVLGSGAGSYERFWLRHRRAPGKVRDAHSLYVETLAELGPAGVGLLVLALTAPVIAGARARRRPLVPAALGAFVAYVVHAGVDWDWEMTSVTLTGLLCGAALIVSARNRATPVMRAPFRVGAVTTALALTALALVGTIGNSALAASETAAAAGNAAETEAEARTAMRWAPWSPKPWAMLAQAHLIRGEEAAARASYRRALAKDRSDWSLWYKLALASRGRASQQALAAAARLNPLSPEIAVLRAARTPRGAQEGLAASSARSETPGRRS